MLTESEWEKENNSTTLLKMLYILTFQTTIVHLPSNYNCCPPPLSIMTIVLLLLLSPFITVLLLSLPPLPNYNCSPSPPCLGTSFVPSTARMISQYGPITSTDLTLDIGKLRWSLLHPLVVLVFWAFFHLKFVNCLFWNLRSLEIYISAKCSG